MESPFSYQIIAPPGIKEPLPYVAISLDSCNCGRPMCSLRASRGLLVLVVNLGNTGTLHWQLSKN